MQQAAIAFQNKAVVYGILFKSTAETRRIIAAEPRCRSRRLALSWRCIRGSVTVLAETGSKLSDSPLGASRQLRQKRKQPGAFARRQRRERSFRNLERRGFRRLEMRTSAL